MFNNVTYPKEIRDRMTLLKAEMEHLKATAATLEVDDPYEWLVIAQTEELSKKIEDTKKFTTKFIEKMKGDDQAAAKILNLMAEGTIKQKKKELMELIKKYPVLASTDKKLLYQRIAFFKTKNSKFCSIPLPPEPIKDTLIRLEQQENEQNS